MKRIQNRAGVVALWSAVWLIVWPALAASSFVVVVWVFGRRFGDGVHPFLVVEPAFFLPVLALWIGAAWVCRLGARRLVVPLRETTEGSRLAGMVVLISIAIVVGVWWWILTETS